MPNLPEKLSEIIKDAGLTPAQATWDCHVPVVKQGKKNSCINNIVLIHHK